MSANFQASPYIKRIFLHCTQASDAPWTSGTLWLVVTEGMASHYCQSTGKALVLADIRTDKFAITKDLQLQHGDVIQFQVKYTHGLAHDCGNSSAIAMELPQSLWFGIGGIYPYSLGLRP